MARTLKTITVRELIALLENEDGDARVVFSADYGDFRHTQQALPIRGEVDDETITESAYSSSGFAINDENDRGQSVLVIR